MKVFETAISSAKRDVKEIGSFYGVNPKKDEMTDAIIEHEILVVVSNSW